MFPIDIIIPWVNIADAEWLKEFAKWKLIEDGDSQEGRFRDCNTLRYVLRSIERNCPWCRYIFLVLASDTQIPDWLNTNNNKLKIVYHRDFIPKKFLPTFNSLVIEMFYPRIEELSENFILINDDMFFTRFREKEFYFKDGLPVYNLKLRPIGSDDFSAWMVNSKSLLDSISNKNSVIYDTFHMPVAYNKIVCSFILDKIKEKLETIFEKSKFRKRYNIIHFIYYYAHILLKRFFPSNECRGMFYFFTTKSTNFNFDFSAVCLNESGQINESDIECLTNILEKEFPNKSSFEI